MKKFEVAILSGGRGTRVKKYTRNIPKCLIEINGKPFLYHQLKYLKKNNIKSVIILVGYLGDMALKYDQHAGVPTLTSTQLGKLAEYQLD